MLKLLLLLALLAAPADAARKKRAPKVDPERSCTVVGVSDGDTLTVRCGEQEQDKVRLAHVDAPEKKQSFGQAAKKFASDLVFGKDVLIVGGTRDRYGRTVARVVLPDGRDLGQELVKAGMAWWYERYSKDARYGALESEARKARRGLWSEPAPVRPWEFRRPRRGEPVS